MVGVCFRRGWGVLWLVVFVKGWESLYLGCEGAHQASPCVCVFIKWGWPGSRGVGCKLQRGLFLPLTRAWIFSRFALE